MQAKQLTSVSEILRKASKEVESAIGSPIVAFFLHKPDQKRRIKTELRELEEIVSEIFNVEFKDIKSRSRKESLSMARQIYVWFAMTKLKISSVALSEILGRDHSTVLYMKKTVENYISINDPQTIEQINLVESYLNTKAI